MSIVTTETRVVHRIDWETLATGVESLVMAKMRDDLVSWAGQRDMISMALGDASDGIKVCELLAEGNWSKVDEKLWSMDTAARDHLYHFIEQMAACENFFAIARGEA